VKKAIQDEFDEKHGGEHLKVGEVRNIAIKLARKHYYSLTKKAVLGSFRHTRLTSNPLDMKVSVNGKPFDLRQISTELLLQMKNSWIFNASNDFEALCVNGKNSISCLLSFSFNPGPEKKRE
jgi:hypothetical protein